MAYPDLKIEVRGDGLRPSTVLREKVVRRVLLSMSRFGSQVLKVTVRLAEPPNLLAGVDRRCRMRASLQKNDDIRSEAINGGFEAAIARAATQLAKRADSALEGGARRVSSPSPAKRSRRRR